MQPLEKQARNLHGLIVRAMRRVNFETKIAELSDIDDKLADPTVWDNPTVAQGISKRSAQLRQQLEPWQKLERDINDLIELISLDDGDMKLDIEQQLKVLIEDFEGQKKELLFTGEYDDHDAIMRITAGVGGTDAQDWAEMLERMYLRWSEKSNMAAKIVERSTGEEAGIKTSVIEISGVYAYGRLRSEHGVHRLVRLSPFNSDNLRQTSFALVEILPQIDTPEEIDIDDKDLRIDVYRSGGHGGQSVNTTDSAVRVTHLPTGTVVAIQNERSQLQNKETALKILRSKLVQMKLEQHAERLGDLQAGESANWGSQIRNYVLHPYTLVKDTRTKYEDKDAKSVLDGKIDRFMTHFLESFDGFTDDGNQRDGV